MDIKETFEPELHKEVLFEILKDSKRFSLDEIYTVSMFGTLIDLNRDYLYFQEYYEMYHKFKNQPAEEKDYWFYYFHKSIRQVGFFGYINSYRIKDNLTDEQTKELLELYKDRYAYRDERRKKDPKLKWEIIVIDYYRAREIKNLLEIRNTQIDLNVTGLLDSLLWDLIASDKTGVIERTLERSFKMHDVEYEDYMRKNQNNDN